MKKVIIAVGIVVIFAAYVFYQHEHQSSQIQTPITTSSNQLTQTPTTQPVSVNNPPATSSPSQPADQTTPPASAPSAPAHAPTPAATPAQSSGQYKDGSYTGSVADAFYGQLQVVAVIQNGKITDIQFPVYPTDGGHTMQVSQQALPQLKSEAIAAQSPNVDVVSGATQDSQAFVQSLQSALNQAKS